MAPGVSVVLEFEPCPFVDVVPFLPRFFPYSTFLYGPWRMVLELSDELLHTTLYHFSFFFMTSRSSCSCWILVWTSWCEIQTIYIQHCPKAVYTAERTEAKTSSVSVCVWPCVGRLCSCPHSHESLILFVFLAFILFTLRPLC